ncbi:type II toxin-antitoxin system PemK/MazF family toxin [Burkholderia sp. Ax-1719]|uniref:type II toxin-antitoxin system PemK/MazF family toxin n=1 Tax=Burkholderia sp. Ax-1719 TaxID=2608334 RepID=UPI001421692F|nr:type II toxin-antitoxin system PemK/MazF family toxin [Burkholderia sp. Ax-1719]NIE63148.1 hypothetical protein [Burkholderia sp. Ax-1719]
MIVVKYLEQTTPEADTSTMPLKGKEIYEDIEEVLLPKPPDGDVPIFTTKKFAGDDSYRWQVIGVTGLAATEAAPQTFEVILKRRAQLSKGEYLTQILKAPKKTPKNVLQRFTIVEVEYGQHSVVGKVNGNVRSNKRYADTVQRGSMPKRRLAVVNQVIVKGRATLVQLMPISSVQPRAGDQTCVDVTDSLSMMVHYHKQSWVVCSMIETVSPTRIMAPLVRWGPRAEGRDTGFKHKLNVPTRRAVEDALMYGVESAVRVAESTELLAVQAAKLALEQEVARLSAQVSSLEERVEFAEAHKEMARDYANGIGQPFELCREEYHEIFGAGREQVIAR